MQAIVGICCSSLRLFHRSSSISNAAPKRLLSVPQRTTVINRRISAVAVPEISTVDYSSSTSVFPAEACDTVGGEACNGEMFPETKPPTATATAAVNKVEAEEIERDYLEYNEPKTVFPGEACDELGGEFCEPEYQQGVYKEKVAMS